MSYFLCYVFIAFFAPDNTALQDDENTQFLLGNTGGTQSVDQVQKNKQDLETKISHHVVEGRYTIEDFMDKSCTILQSVAGKNIKVEYIDPSIRLNNRAVNTTNVNMEAHNGIVHEVDGVLSITESVECNDNSAGSLPNTHLSMQVLVAMVIGFVGTLYM